jgi:murein DD-endopeptidase MepM/ murein hydrolase activator NlpD
MHYGNDFKGNTGDPIFASDGGVVEFTGSRGNYGLLVIINHGNGYKTYYSHCSKILVEVGQKVGQGEHIANIGRTGNAVGPHLHFEIQYKGVARNPFNYLGIRVGG